MTPKEWFTYDACDGFEEHETEEAARDYAERLIDQYRIEAQDNGWCDEVWSVKVGRITAWTVEVERRKPEEEEGTAWDWICDYCLSGKEGA